MSRSALRALVTLCAAVALAACGGSSSGGGGTPPAPAVAALTPSTGTVSTVVLIAGSGFGTSPVVKFSAGGHEYQAALTTASDSKIEAAVPAVDPALAASGTSFDVTVQPAGGGAATLHGAFTMARPVVADVNGGLVGSGTPGSPFILDGSAFGDPAVVGTAVSFSVEFADTVGGSFPAAVTAGAWSNGFVVGNAPNGLTAGQRYQVTVTTPSGTSAPRWFQVLGGVSFSPSNIGWSAGPSLPFAEQGLAAVVVPLSDPSGVTTSYVFALGGNDSSVAADSWAASSSTVVVNELLPTVTSAGAFAWSSWAEATALPQARAFAAAVTAGPGNSVVTAPGELYVLGGLDPAGLATSSVYRAPVAADGTLGAWSRTTSLPRARYGHAAVVLRGRIYVAGGNGPDGLPVNTVFYAPIHADGTLGDWLPGTDLPAPVAHHQLASYAGTLFAMGGTSDGADPISSTLDPVVNGTVWSTELDLRDGSFVSTVSTTAWQDQGALSPKAREKFSAVVAGSYLLVTGGLYSGDATSSSESSYAALQSDPTTGKITLGAFNGATGSSTIYGPASGYQSPYDHAAVSYVDVAGNAHVLVLGGGNVGKPPPTYTGTSTTGRPQAGVWFQY